MLHHLRQLRYAIDVVLDVLSIPTTIFAAVFFAASFGPRQATISPEFTSNDRFQIEDGQGRHFQGQPSVVELQFTGSHVFHGAEIGRVQDYLVRSISLFCYDESNFHKWKLLLRTFRRI